MTPARGSVGRLRGLAWRLTCRLTCRLARRAARRSGRGAACRVAFGAMIGVTVCMAVGVAVPTAAAAQASPRTTDPGADHAARRPAGRPGAAVPPTGRRGASADTAPPPTQPATAPARPIIEPVADLVVGDGVMVIKAGTGKLVYIGIGSATTTSTVTVPASAVDEFVAETQTIVRLGTRRLPTQVLDRPVLEEGTTGRALSVTRHIERPQRPRAARPSVEYHFFVSDEHLRGFTIPATPVETKAVLLALHRAARRANALSAPPDSTPPARPARRARARPAH